MNISKIATLNHKFQKENRFVQNPINFTSVYSGGEILNPQQLASDNEISKEAQDCFLVISAGAYEHFKVRKSIDERVQKLEEKIDALNKFSNNLNLSYDEVGVLIDLSHSKKPEDFDALVKKINDIYLDLTGCKCENNEVINELAGAVQKTLRKKDTFDVNLNKIIERLKSEIDSRVCDIRSQANKLKFEAPTGYHLTQEQKSSECFIDLDKTIDLPKNVKLALKAYLDKIRVGFATYVVNNKKNQDFLSSLENKTLHKKLDLESILGVNPETIFDDSEVLELDEKSKQEQWTDATLLAFPKGHVIEKIIDDVQAKRVANYSLYNEKNILPLKFKKYSGEGETKKYDSIFVDLDDEQNKKILKYSAQIKKYISQLPFEISQGECGPYIDINSDYNKKLLDFEFCNQYPQQSEYFISENSLSKVKKIDIPVKYLESLGFGKAQQIANLVQAKKIKGGIDSNNEYFVSLDESIFFTKGSDLQTLNELRAKNPRIKAFKDFAKGLNITQKRLDIAVITGEVQIIDEYITGYDRETRFIDISKQKNQEFIRKIKFEQALKKSMSEAQRAENQKQKIAKQDVRQRLQGVRMALVWSFMPKTKEIASTLAKQDGYVVKLLIKEDNEDETLTPHEEAKINSYRKEMWLQAGVDELNQAHKRANEIMNDYKEQGINAIDYEYRSIFEKYGFC